MVGGRLGCEERRSLIAWMSFLICKISSLTCWSVDKVKSGGLMRCSAVLMGGMVFKVWTCLWARGVSGEGEAGGGWEA